MAGNRPGPDPDREGFALLLRELATTEGASISQIAQRRGKSERQVRRWLEQVRALGYRVVRERNRYRTIPAGG